jgi:hypothetical protein
MLIIPPRPTGAGFVTASAALNYPELTTFVPEHMVP